MKSVEIRHSEDSDIEKIRSIYAEPSNYTATLQLPFPSPEVWKKRLSTPSEGSFSLVACREGEILGQLSMSVMSNPRRKHVANFGMAVKASTRRKGVGSALVKAAIELAEKWLVVRRIELEVYTDNTAAIELYKKFGFAIEGTAKYYAFRNGEFVDVHFMARVVA
jgi:putative acetyltransferase